MQDFNIFLFYLYSIENDIFYRKASAKYFNHFINGEYAYYKKDKNIAKLLTYMQA